MPYVSIVDYARADILDASARDPRGRAFEVPRLLAIELQEGSDMFEHFRLGREANQMIGDANLDAAIAADNNVVSGLDADDADILDRRFGAIARAAGDRQFHLMRRP